jgi:hypothetical protein
LEFGVGAGAGLCVCCWFMKWCLSSVLSIRRLALGQYNFLEKYLSKYLYFDKQDKTLHKGRGANFGSKDQKFWLINQTLYLPTRIKFSIQTNSQFFAKNAPELALKLACRYSSYAWSVSSAFCRLHHAS